MLIQKHILLQYNNEIKDFCGIVLNNTLSLNNYIYLIPSIFDLTPLIHRLFTFI